MFNCSVNVYVFVSEHFVIVKVMRFRITVIGERRSKRIRAYRDVVAELNGCKFRAGGKSVIAYNKTVVRAQIHGIEFCAVEGVFSDGFKFGSIARQSC